MFRRFLSLSLTLALALSVVCGIPASAAAGSSSADPGVSQELPLPDSQPVPGDGTQTGETVDTPVVPEPEPEPEPEPAPQAVPAVAGVLPTLPVFAVSGTPVPLPPPDTFNLKINIAGDVMIAAYKNITKADNFNDYANKKDPSYFLSKVKPIFEKDDLTVVNLENVLTDKNLKEVGKNHSPAYWYRSRTSNTRILTSSSVEAVSLANNHTGDYGEQGRKDTIAAVEKAGLMWGNDSNTMYYEKNGYRVAIICSGLWGEYQADAICKRIQAATPYSDFQIVFYHGGTERVHSPEQWRIRASRKLVDAGADLVIGNHPHVIQPMETYKGVDIVYSMGNFCFGDEKRAENRTIIYSLNLKIQARDGKLLQKSAEIIPCYVYTAATNNYCPAPITNAAEKQRVLDFMNWKRSSPL